MSWFSSTRSAGIPRLLRGERLALEYRIIRPDGDLRWILDNGFPIADVNGRVVRVAGVAQDLTERRMAEDNVRASEARLRTLSEGIPQLVWRAAEKGRWSWASPQWTDFTGQPERDSHGLGWLAMVHPDDRFVAERAWERTLFSGELETEYRLRHRVEGNCAGLRRGRCLSATTPAVLSSGWEGLLCTISLPFTCDVGELDRMS